MRPGVAPATSARKRFRRRRARAFGASGVIVTSLALVGWLFLAPHELATVRLGGLSLAWWATLGVFTLGVAGLVLGTGE
jgi:hypothetical protein